MRKIIILVFALVVVGNVKAEFGDGKLIEETKKIKNDRVEVIKATSAAERKDAKLELKEDKKERSDTLKEDIKLKRAEFKEKLAKIKDEKKQKIVEKLDIRFSEVNSKRTTQMTSNLDKMTTILDKLFDKGVNVATPSNAIQTALDAVKIQAAKTYVISISTEANLKMDVGKVRSQLEADLKVVNELVVAARKAVAAAILTLKK